MNGFCPTVGSGEKWIAAGAPWFVNDTFEAEPADFVRAGDTPLADFQAKFTALKLVIDRATRQARTVVFPNSSQLFLGPGDAFPGIPSVWVLISPITLGTVQPLSVGDHVVEVYWVFSATHCDGVGDSIADNCLPAGDVLYVTVEFAVTPGHN